MESNESCPCTAQQGFIKSQDPIVGVLTAGTNDGNATAMADQSGGTNDAANVVTDAAASEGSNMDVDGVSGVGGGEDGSGAPVVDLSNAQDGSGVSVADLSNALQSGLRVQPKKPSGAQRKKRQKLKKLADADPSDVSSKTGKEKEGVVGPKSQTAKRRREEGDTPSSSKQVVKRSREGSLPNYKAAATKASQVAVVFRDDHGRQLTQAQADHVRTELVKALQGCNDLVPKFERSGLKQGAFWVTCADQGSFDWLLQQAHSISAWEGDAFTIMKADSLMLKKVFMIVPGPEKVTRDILTTLAFQNPGLKTDRWQIWARKVETKHLLLTIGVDEASLGVLGQLDMRPYYELSRLTTWIADKAQKGKQQ